jgi:hypothetical protein
MRKPKTSDQTEHYVKQQVKRILSDTGWTYWMPNAGVFGRSGVSDFLAVKHPKLFMAIETKYKDVVTALQWKFLTNVYEAGHYAFVVDETNIEELRGVLTMKLIELHPTRFDILSLMKWRDQLAEKLDTLPIL